MINHELLNLLVKPRRAIFRPKNLATVKSELAIMIGVMAYWGYVGHADIYGSYPKQSRWVAIINIKPYDKIDQRFFGYWLPEEELQFTHN
jgi:hypothetical protein